MIKHFISAGFLFLSILSFSQNNSTPVQLDSKSRLAIFMSISQLMKDNYVEPETAIKMSNYIEKREKGGAYNYVTDPVAFSDMLTNDMYSIYHDGHLSVQYNPALEAQLLETAASVSPANDTPPQRNINANFGFRKVEILNGNIGYINLEHFWADKIYGKETMNAAMQFVSHANALIIDLRNNGGGSPETVTMLCSYFFDKKIHVNDTYSRPDNSTTEFWTTPDSSLKSLTKMPLYILTSSKTFSAAEEFAYDLKNLKRADIIGETTGGGSHNTFERPVGNGFVIYIPYGKAVNAITKTNWEKVGVKPDVQVPAAKALETAEMNIFQNLISKTKEEDELFELNWQFELLKAANNPISFDAATLKKYAGIYSDRTFTFENGKLFYQRTGKPKFELEAMAPGKMKGKDNTYFKIEFVENKQGLVNKVKVYYQDNRIETSERTE